MHESRTKFDRPYVSSSFIRRAIARTTAGAVLLIALAPAAANAQANTPDTPSSAPALGAEAPKTAQPPAPYRWRGVYFGGIVGSSWAANDVTTSTIFSPTGYFPQNFVTAINDEGEQTIRPGSPIYGGEAGYDFQVARLVFGGSYDFSVMTMNDFVVASTNYPGSASTFSINQVMETNWLMTARARVGWVSGRRLLIFGTAGIAWVDLKYEEQFSDNLATARESGDFDELKSAWIFGGGAEWRLTRNWSAKGEYLYADFGETSITSTNLTTSGGAFPTNVFTHTSSFPLNVVKVSIKFRY